MTSPSQPLGVVALTVHPTDEHVTPIDVRAQLRVIYAVSGRHRLVVARERHWRPAIGRSVEGRLRRLARQVRAGEIAGIAVADHQSLVEQVTGWAEGAEAIRRAGGHVLDAQASGYLARDARQVPPARPCTVEFPRAMADVQADQLANRLRPL